MKMIIMNKKEKKRMFNLLIRKIQIKKNKNRNKIKIKNKILKKNNNMIVKK